MTPTRFRPQKQAFVHDEDNGIYGDCFRTCIAMCLGLDRDAVPHFADPNEFPDWRAGFQEWLAARELTIFEIGFEVTLRPLELARQQIDIEGYLARNAV